MVAGSHFLLVSPRAKKKVKTKTRNIITSGNPDTKIFEEIGGIVAVEAEHFAIQTEMKPRKWYITSTTQTPKISPDGDENHTGSASAGAYIEILPDTR